MAAASVTLRWLVPMMLLCLAISPCRAQIVIDSPDGPVTGHEVDSVITYASSLVIPYLQYDATSTHNNLADGKWGIVLEGLNDLYGVTRHNPALRAEGSQLLDLAIEWTDTWLVHRNDMPLGERRVMWTGNVDPVWPPNCPTCDASTYYESTADINSGHVKGGVGIAAGILWAKDWIFRHAGCSTNINTNTNPDERDCDRW